MFFSELKIPPTYYLIDDYRRMGWLKKELLNSREFAFDIETNHPTVKSKEHKRRFFKEKKARTCGISFAWGRDSVSTPWKPGLAAYVPLSTADDYDYWGKRQPFIMETIKEILLSPVPKVAQNGKFDTKCLLRFDDLEVYNFWFDTMLAHGLLDEENLVSSHALKSKFNKDGSVASLGMADAYLDTSASQFKEDLDDALEHYDKQLKRYSKVPLQVLYPYGCADADLTLSLRIVFSQMLADEGMSNVFHDIVMPTQRHLMQAEVHGMPLDIQRATEEKTRLQTEADVQEARVLAVIGHKINIGSDQQLGALLFDNYNLPGGRRNKHGWVVDAEALGKLDHPIIEPLLKFRSAYKMLGTYVDGPLEQVEETTHQGSLGWVHTDYYINSLTGRLRSNDPNLSNLSRPENGGLTAKGIYCCPEDYRFIFMDYSQAELRVAAHLSQEPAWIDAFHQGVDVHSLMAVRAFGLDCDPSEVATRYKSKRSDAKAVSFGILFGQSSFALAESLGMSIEEAEFLINEEYFGAAPVLKSWIDNQHAHAKYHGYVCNQFGRRRHLPDAQLVVPNGMRWPERDVRPSCYRNGPYLAALDIDPEDMHILTAPIIKQQIHGSGHREWLKCMDCSYTHSCVVNREVKYVKSKVAAAMRVAVNMPVQGGSVDIVSKALALIGDEYRRQRLDAVPVMHIHDEICVFVHVSQVEIAKRIMEFYMSDYMVKYANLCVPMPVDGEVCRRWGSKHVLGDSTEKLVAKKLHNPKEFSGLDQMCLDHLTRYPGDAFEDLRVA